MPLNFFLANRSRNDETWIVPCLVIPEIDLISVGQRFGILNKRNTINFRRVLHDTRESLLSKFWELGLGEFYEPKVTIQAAEFLGKIREFQMLEEQKPTLFWEILNIWYICQKNWKIKPHVQLWLDYKLKKKKKKQGVIGQTKSIVLFVPTFKLFQILDLW